LLFFIQIYTHLLKMGEREYIFRQSLIAGPVCVLWEKRLQTTINEWPYAHRRAADHYQIIRCWSETRWWVFFSVLTQRRASNFKPNTSQHPTDSEINYNCARRHLCDVLKILCCSFSTPLVAGLIKNLFGRRPWDDLFNKQITDAHTKVNLQGSQHSEKKKIFGLPL
jgi:hypothetical protein